MTQENVQVSLQDLQTVRKSLKDSLKMIDSWIAAQTEEERPQPKSSRTVPSEPSKKPKLPALGVCMFVNKRVLKEKNIMTRGQLEGCPERCSSKAFHMKSGITLCTRHKDSDISKMEDIISGREPEFTVVQEVPPPQEDNGPLPEGDYANREDSRTDLEREIDQCDDLEQLLEKTERVFPCRIGHREVCMVSYQQVYYIIDPIGECLGKVTQEEKIADFDMKMKTKEYFDVTGSIEGLMNTDKLFLETFHLSYSARYCQAQ